MQSALGRSVPREIIKSFGQEIPYFSEANLLLISVQRIQGQGIEAEATLSERRGIDGAMTAKKFSAYVERCLAPTLKRKDIVVVDNLPAQGRRCARGD
jgi:hypothetical protein